MRKIEYLISIVMIIIIVFSCEPKLKQGRIVETRFEPRRTYVMLIPMRIGKITTLIPYTIIDNEDWVVTIEGEYEGEIIQEDFYVTEERYNCVQRGDIFIVSKDCSMEDNNNDKTKKE